MANQIVLAWDVTTTNSSKSPAAAAVDVAAVPLYNNVDTDPVLGQLFGVTVASDVTAPSGPAKVTRTLTLNMTSAVGAPTAPPPFPCRPTTNTPPVLPYPLRKTVTLAGSFLTVTGSPFVATSASQVPALQIGDTVQFTAQLGVFYTVLLVAPSGITLTAPYSGTNGDLGAVKEVAAPATIVAFLSTSPLDTFGVAGVTPPVPAGSGARTVSMTYLDSLGAAGVLVDVPIFGREPIPFALAGGTIDIAVITSLRTSVTGGFGNSVGQITLVELSAPPPPLPANPTRQDLQRQTDTAQGLITRPLVYLPQSYFALTQQGSNMQACAGDFLVTTGSIDVPTTADQTGVLAPGNLIQFAAQMENDTPFGAAPVFYTVASVSPKLVTLTAPYTGLAGPGLSSVGQSGQPSGTVATLGPRGRSVINLATAATRVSPILASPPTNDQLAAGLGQFVNPGMAIPPPNPPLAPSVMSPAVVAAPAAPPNFLSDLFTQTLALALGFAAVPLQGTGTPPTDRPAVIPLPITFI